jgi:putative nucleotidyltransferase with HDIG domain
MKRILFVDDEPNLLEGLRRLLRPYRDEWDMTFIEGGQAALLALNDNQFDVVVTDMRMPVVDGAKLLEFVKDRHPGMARIVLSGQTDNENLVRATCAAHQFIGKPCDPGQLQNAVTRACHLRSLLHNDAIISIVGGMDSLPSMPDLYVKLTEEMNAESVSLKKIAAVVSKDLAMTAKVLQLVNSAQFCMARHVESIEQAVIVLGEEVIRSLALSDAVFRVFNKGFDARRFAALWQHSLTVSAVAHALAKAESSDRFAAEQAMQAGMLHDIGKLILATTVPEDYCKIEAATLASTQSLHATELQMLGCDHGQVGAYLLGLWGLPDGIVEAVCYHHRPALCPHSHNEFTPLVAVHIASTLVHQYLPQPELKPMEAELNQTWLDSIGLAGKADGWRAITQDIIAKMEASS